MEGEIDLCVISNNTNGNTGLVGIQDNKIYNFENNKIVDIEYLKENATIFFNNKIHTNEFLYWHLNSFKLQYKLGKYIYY